MKKQFCQYPNAYSADHTHYSYFMDDGSKVCLHAGEEGVTEEWIAKLKDEHIAEMNMLRRGRSKGAGQNKLLSLTLFEGDAADKSFVLIDPAANVEENYCAAMEHKEQREKLRRALAVLTPEQRRLLMDVRVKKIPITQIAKEANVGKTAICNRLSKIDQKLKKFCQGG